MTVSPAHDFPTSAWRQAAQLAMARASQFDVENLPEARQDYATVRLAELVQKELAKAPRLRPEQVVALKAIISGTDPAAVLPDAIAARPAHSTSAA